MSLVGSVYAHEGIELPENFGPTSSAHTKIAACVLTSRRLAELIGDLTRELEPFYIAARYALCFSDLIMVCFVSLLDNGDHGAWISVGINRTTHMLFSMRGNRRHANINDFEQQNPEYVSLCRAVKCGVDAIVEIIGMLPQPIAEEIAPEISPGYVKLS